MNDKKDMTLIQNEMYGLIDQAAFETLWRGLQQTHPGDNYITRHKDRYYELFDHLAHFTAGRESPRVCEIGVSAFTRFYTQLLPQIDLVTVDRSLDLFGVEAPFAIEECGASQHYNIDLNRESIHPDWGTPPLGTFDYVVFCEVLEHLRVNPVQLFEELLSLLKPDGLLYLTTPNFFSYYHLRQIAHWENPQDIFHRRGEDKHAACHYREFSMAELIQFTGEAGGKIIKAYHSDVWEDETLRKALAQTPEMYSNLVIVAALPNSRVAAETIHSLPGAASLSQSNGENSASIAYLQAEVTRLQAAYDGGFFARQLRRFYHKVFSRR
jgi:SAM-dependent methyltransferase